MAQRGLDMAQIVSPALPNFRARIQPPAPDGSEREPELKGAMAPLETPVVHYDVAARAKELGLQRLVFSWHRSGDVLVGVEQAPDWELVGASVRIKEEHLRAALPIFERLGTRIKDLTAEFGNMTPDMGPSTPSEEQDVTSPLGVVGSQAGDAGAGASPARGAAPRRARATEQNLGAIGRVGSVGLGTTPPPNGSGGGTNPSAGVESVKQDDT
jgi:hypothetical protein